MNHYKYVTYNDQCYPTDVPDRWITGNANVEGRKRDR